MMSFCQELFERDVNVVLVNSNLKHPYSLHNIHSVQGEFQKLFMEMAFLEQKKTQIRLPLAQGSFLPHN